jgi:hypothetical protein
VLLFVLAGRIELYLRTERSKTLLKYLQSHSETTIDDLVTEFSGGFHGLYTCIVEPYALIPGEYVFKGLRLSDILKYGEEGIVFVYGFDKNYSSQIIKFSAYEIPPIVLPKVPSVSASLWSGFWCGCNSAKISNFHKEMGPILKVTEVANCDNI